MIVNKEKLSQSKPILTLIISITGELRIGKLAWTYSIKKLKMYSVM